MPRDRRIVIDDAPVTADRSRIGAVGDLETELVLFNERLRLFPDGPPILRRLDAFRRIVRRSQKAASYALKYRHQEPRLHRITPTRQPDRQANGFRRHRRKQS